jgi:hypothetical protein
MTLAVDVFKQTCPAFERLSAKVTLRLRMTISHTSKLNEEMTKRG